MADKESKKREQDAELDSEISDTSFDDLSLDDPFGGSEGTVVNGKRKPDSPTKTMVVEGVKGVASGVSAGIKRELFKAMPNLGAVSSEISQTYSEFRDLKDELSRQLTPMLISIENSARKVLPKAKGMMPKKLYDKIGKKLKERAEEHSGSSWSAPSKEQVESDQIKSELAAIFEAQQEQQYNAAVEQKKNDILNQAIDAARSKRLNVSLTHVYDSVRSTELFHRTVHTAYLKKSLELKYKHLFVARDTFNLLSKSMAAFEGYFKSIEKNTMLPDMAKVQIGDYHRRNVTQMYGTMMADFMGNMRRNIIGGIKKSALNLVQGFGQFADMASMAADASAMMDGMPGGGFNVKNTVARGIGKGLGYLIGAPQAKRLLGKISPVTRNIDSTLGDLKSTVALKLSTLGRNWGNSGNAVLQALSSFIPQLSVRRSGENVLLDKPDTPATFDIATRQSIVEIIPGYLSKMLHSLEKTRTGDDNVEQEVYNAYARKFTTTSALRESIERRMYGSDYDRSQMFAETMGTLRAGYEHSGREGDSKEHYKEYEKDINRFMVNHGVMREGFRPDELSKYVVSGGTEGDQGYIDRVTEGFEHKNKLEVLQVILEGITNKDGSLDKRAIRSIDSTIVKYLRNDSYIRELSKIGETLGYRSLFSDKIDTKTRRSLEANARKGDRWAEAALHRTTDLFGDDNELGLSKIAEEQTNIDYELARQNADTETGVRSRQFKEYDKGIEQFRAGMEKTGLSKASEYVKGKYAEAKKWASNRYDSSSKDITKFGIDATAKAAEAIKTARKKAGKTYTENVPKDVKDALETIKSYASYVPKEASKMLDKLEHAYDNHVPDSVKDAIKDIRKDISRSAATETIKETVNETAKKATKREPGVAATKPTEDSKSPVDITSDELKARVDKALDKKHTVARGASPVIMAPPPVYKTGDDRLADLVEKFTEALKHVNKEPAPTVAPLEATKPSTSLDSDIQTRQLDLLQTWFDLYKENGEFQQAQLQELEKYMSDEHGTIFDAIAQVDDTLKHMKAVGSAGGAATRKPGWRNDPIYRAVKGSGKGVLRGAATIIKKIPGVYGKIYGGALSGIGSAVGGIGKGLGEAASSVTEHMGKHDILGTLRKGFKSLSKGAKNIGKGYVNLYGKVIDAAGGVGKAVAGGLFGKGADPYVDIYRKDEIGGNYKPILTKVRQERGVYFKDGKKVKQSADIKEPVYDAEGHEIISKDDIDHGIVGVDNKPISPGRGSEGLISKAFDVLKGLAPGAGGALKTIGGLYSHIYKGLFGLFTGGVKGAGKLAGNFINRLFGFDVGGTSKELISLVKLIQADVDLIARGEKKGTKGGDADGDGDVDGSYADQMQNKKKKEFKVAQADDDHVDVDWRKKKNKNGDGEDDDEDGRSLWDKAKDLARGSRKLGKWTRHGGRRFKALGRLMKGRAGKVLTRATGLAKVLGAKALPALGAVGHGIGAAGSAIGGMLGSVGGAIAPFAAPAALAALAGYGIYRGVKGFSKENTVDNLGKSNDISRENQVSTEDRIYSALGMNTKIGAKTMKFLASTTLLPGLIKGIRGNDNPLTDKEITIGRNKLMRKMEKGLPGYDRILQEYEKAVNAGNWRRARELSGQEADGIIKSLWKNNIVGQVVGGVGSFVSGLFFGKKDEAMTEAEIKKTRDKFQSVINKGGSGAKNAERLLSKFDDYVAEQDWKNARKIAGMEKRGLFGKLFQDSKGNIKWGSLLGAATGGIGGYLIGSLFNKADKDKPMTEEEVRKERERLTRLAQRGNKAAERILEQFDEAVTEQRWKKARSLVNKEVVSNLVKLDRGLTSAAKWTVRIGTLGLSTLFESDQSKPMTDDEIQKFTNKMNYLIEKHNDKLARRKLDKFEEAVAKEDWEKARRISKMDHKSLATRAVKSVGRFFFGDDDSEMTEQEITKFRESMGRKIQMGNKTAQKKLDAFEDAVATGRWRKARAISDTPDDGVVQKNAKMIGKTATGMFRFLFGGDGKAMSDSELSDARKRLNWAVQENKKGAQKRLDMFEDYVADEKWEKARRLVKLPYENVNKRIAKAISGTLFGDDKDALSPNEIEKFQKECEQRIEDGDPKAQKILDKFNSAVEMEHWAMARKISGLKASGIVGSIGKSVKGVWDWVAGNSDYEDCQKLREQIEERAFDDETGLIEKGLEDFEKLVRRQKYNEAMKMGKDLLKMKSSELTDKYKLKSDAYEDLLKQGAELEGQIGKRIKAEKSWFSLKRMQLKGLKSELMSSKDEWSSEFFDNIRDEMSSITGEDEYSDIDEPDEATVKEGEKLIKEIEAAKDQLSWFTSPIMKTKLARLKSEVQSDPTMWNEGSFAEWRERLAEITGKKVEPTPEGQVEVKAQHPFRPEEYNEDTATSLEKVTDQELAPDETHMTDAEFGAKVSSAISGAPEQVRQTAGDGVNWFLEKGRQVGSAISSGIKRLGKAITGRFGNSTTEPESTYDVAPSLEAMSLARQERARLKESFENAFATGGFVTKARRSVDVDGKPLVYGEAGPEAVVPMHERPGNLLHRIGSKLGKIIYGNGLDGPMADRAQDASIHVSDRDSDPMENYLADQLARTAKRQRGASMYVSGAPGDFVKNDPARLEESAASAMSGLRNVNGQMSDVVSLQRPKSTADDPAWSKNVVQAQAMNSVPEATQAAVREMRVPSSQPTEAMYAQLLEQNRKMLELLTAVCAKDGLKISGMDTLTEAAASAGGSPTVVNNTTVVNSSGSEMGGLDLRKRQG